jgi:putative transposase
MPYFHLVARTRWPHAPFQDRAHCADFWTKLRRRFPRTLGAVLMPDHLHLIVECGEPGEVLRRLRIETTAFNRARFLGKSLWDPLSAAQSIPNGQHLLRQIRYVHLNPCRAGLATDPLEWEWSTHRDAVGAVSESWIDLPALHRLSKTNFKTFADVFHQYVSGDPSVQIKGTTLPVRPSSQGVKGIVPLDQIGRSILEVTRAAPGEHLRRSSSRRLAVLLAEQLGMSRKTQIAEWAGVSDRAVRAILKVPPTPAERASLAAALWILSDPKRFEPQRRHKG